MRIIVGSALVFVALHQDLLHSFSLTIGFHKAFKPTKMLVMLMKTITIIIVGS